MPGRYFDEWQVGDRVSHAVTRTVTEADNVLISTLTPTMRPKVKTELTSGLPNSDFAAAAWSRCIGWGL